MKNRITIARSQRLSLNTALNAALRVLRLDALSLTSWIEQEASANPALLTAPPPAPRAWLPRWHDALARIGHVAGGPDQTARAGSSLCAHVSAEISRLRLPPREAELAQAFLDHLGPSGWLEAEVKVIAKTAAAPIEEAEALLARLQTIDPPGLFARDLADCLALQARAAGEEDAAMQAVLRHLPLVARGDVAEIAARAGFAPAVIAERIRRLRRYDPKPGGGFEPGAALVSEPDLLLRHGPHGPEIELNHSVLPALKLADTPLEGRARAQEVIRLVEGRNAMLLRIGRDLFQRQPRVIDEGFAGLLPMTMSEVATGLDLHQSTVSRVVAGTSIDTGRGTLWLRALFSPAVSKQGPSGAALRERLAQMIAAEDPARPQTDAELAQALAQGGNALARRTVAKYREMLGIPTASIRKRRNQAAIRDVKGRLRH